VHTDVGGPLKTSSLNDSKYYITFIDDHTRMCWIYFMKYKYEVADIFWKFKAWVEKQSTYKMQVIRSDNGTEYTLEKFNKFYEKESSWRSQDVYCMTKDCQRIYGLKLQTQQCFF
jgi:hypothetical protein